LVACLRERDHTGDVVDIADDRLAARELIRLIVEPARKTFHLRPKSEQLVRECFELSVVEVVGILETERKRNHWFDRGGIVEHRDHALELRVPEYVPIVEDAVAHVLRKLELPRNELG